MSKPEGTPLESGLVGDIEQRIKDAGNEWLEIDITDLVKSIVDSHSLEYLNRQLAFCIHGVHVSQQGESFTLMHNR